MTVTRREFMRSVGLTVVSLAGARHLSACGPAASPGGTVTGGGATTTAFAAPAWARLRDGWLALPGLCGPAAAEWNTDPESADLGRRQAEHRAALDELVAASELRAPVADLLQAGFEDTSFHLWRICNGPTCYEPTMLGAALMESRGRVAQRLQALDEMIASGAIDADAAAESRATFEQQLAVLDAERELGSLEGQERWDAESRLVDVVAAGGPEPTADEREAARVLVDLLLTP